MKLIKIESCIRRQMLHLLCISVLCLLTACQIENETTSATILPEPPSDVSVLPFTTPEPTVLPTVLPNQTKEILQNALEKQYGFMVIQAEYRDFDRNGTYEMFAFVLERELAEQYVDGDWLYGKVVYLNQDLQLEELTMPFYIWDTSATRVIPLEDVLLFVADEAFVSETVSRVYAVYEDEPECLLNGLGYFFAQNGNIFVNISDYDMVVEQDGFSSGHTWKNYYFYYDKEKRCFREYVAKQITQEEFLSLPGAESVLEEIRLQYPSDATLEFLYRENGMLHINIAYCEDTFTIQKNVSVRLENGRLTGWEANDGRYRTECMVEETLAESDRRKTDE